MVLTFNKSRNLLAAALTFSAGMALELGGIGKNIGATC